MENKTTLKRELLKKYGDRNPAGFVQLKWGMSRRHAYRLMDAAEVKNNLCPIGHISEPNINELHARKIVLREPRQATTTRH